MSDLEKKVQYLLNTAEHQLTDDQWRWLKNLEGNEENASEAVVELVNDLYDRLA